MVSLLSSWFTTITLLLSMMVLSLRVMMMTVHSENSCLMVAYTVTSVSRSTAAVASSRMRTLVFLSRARARHISCL